MSTVQPVILGEMPSLSKLYVNAAAQTARRRVLGTHNGSNLPVTSHEVRGVRADVGNLTAYQHLIGLTARDTLPAGYLHALAFPLAMSVMNRDDFPLPLLGMVHLYNHVEQRSPVLFTESLDIRARVENLRGHRSGTQLDVVAEIRGADTPDIKWTGRSSYLAKGVFLPASTSQRQTTARPISRLRTPPRFGIWGSTREGRMPPFPETSTPST
ncbi:maoc domain protein dehydratase [Arthrobacter sp. Hiyo4]|nr:maoc domain protein dehydratase [Arthrobacter sp. Hiyo4]